VYYRFPAMVGEISTLGYTKDTNLIYTIEAAFMPCSVTVSIPLASARSRQKSKRKPLWLLSSYFRVNNKSRKSQIRVHSLLLLGLTLKKDSGEFLFLSQRSLGLKKILPRRIVCASSRSATTTTLSFVGQRHSHSCAWQTTVMPNNNVK
jgi:hypothetical protein